MLHSPSSSSSSSSFCFPLSSVVHLLTPPTPPPPPHTKTTTTNQPFTPEGRLFVWVRRASRTPLSAPPAPCAHFGARTFPLRAGRCGTLGACSGSPSPQSCPSREQPRPVKRCSWGKVNVKVELERVSEWRFVGG